MSKEIAEILYETARAHALSSDLLYRSSAEYAEKEGLPDPEQFAFNGTYSLSVFYLVCLGLELFLKSAIVLSHKDADYDFLRKFVGHDLSKALDIAEERGFTSEAPNLRGIVEQLRHPYLAHYFRYDRPEQMALPNVIQVVEMFYVLDQELGAALAVH